MAIQEGHTGVVVLLLSFEGIKVSGKALQSAKNDTIKALLEQASTSGSANSTMGSTDAQASVKKRTRKDKSPPKKRRCSVSITYMSSEHDETKPVHVEHQQHKQTALQMARQAYRPFEQQFVWCTHSKWCKKHIDGMDMDIKCYGGHDEVKLVIDEQDRRLDSMLICGEHVSIGEFKCDPKYIFHAIGQILGYEQILLKTKLNGSQGDTDYKEAYDKGTSYKFVAFKEEPDDFSKDLCTLYGIRVWWEQLHHVPCGPVPEEASAELDQWRNADKRRRHWAETPAPSNTVSAPSG